MMGTRRDPPILEFHAVSCCLCMPFFLQHTVYMLEVFSVSHDTSIIDCCWLCQVCKELVTFLYVLSLCHIMVICFMHYNCYFLFQVLRCVNSALCCLCVFLGIAKIQ
jgi:hypothetical protein